MLVCLLAMVPFQEGSSPRAVTGAEWKRGMALLRGGKHQRAMAYAAKLRKANPRHVFPHYLHYTAAERLARKGRGELWSISARSARIAARLEPDRDTVHLAHALWCWWNAKDYASIARNGDPVLDRGRDKLGMHNWSLSWYYVIGSHLKLGRTKEARGYFARAVSALESHPGILNLSALLSPSRLFCELPAGSPELAGWVARLAHIAARHGAKGRAFLLASAYTAIRAGDAAYHAGNHASAFKLYSTPLRRRALLARVDAHTHDELRIRRMAAEYRRRRPAVIAKHTRYLKMLVVPRSRLKLPLRPGAPPTFAAGRKLRREAVHRMRRNFLIFADSVLALTDGRVQWRWAGKIELKGAVMTRANTRHDPEYKRFIAQAFPRNIEPKPSAAVLRELAGADMILLLWPGTSHPPGIFVTNGGATEYALYPKGRGIRGLIISEGDRSGRRGNSVLFFHHEFFHLLEWGYYDGTFPINHGYRNRGAWPRDYRGRTEFDFYEETYRKRVMPADGLLRMQWRKGGTHLYRRYLRIKNKRAR